MTHSIYSSIHHHYRTLFHFSFEIWQPFFVIHPWSALTPTQPKHLLPHTSKPLMFHSISSKCASGGGTLTPPHGTCASHSRSLLDSFRLFVHSFRFRSVRCRVSCFYAAVVVVWRLYLDSTRHYVGKTRPGVLLHIKRIPTPPSGRWWCCFVI